LTYNIDAMEALYADSYEAPERFIDKVAAEFTAMLNDWHSRPETWDNAIDKQIHEWYANAKPVYPKRPYFSPSAADACPRELYEKGIGSKRDITGQQPHQGRWTRIGTSVGDIIQRDILFIEKHMEGARFRFERNDRGEPMFEDFAKRNVPIECGGVRYHLYGAPDGILIYTDENGEQHRIGLEIKSKQTTPARTSLHSFKAPDEKHEAQTIAYSIMYNVDYYLIVYVNTAHKAWSMSDADFEATPDIRVFGIDCTVPRKAKLIEDLAEVQRMINERKPPMPDLSKWTFNGYKTAIAQTVTDEELTLLESQVELAKKSRLPEFKKQAYAEALDDLLKRRAKVLQNDAL